MEGLFRVFWYPTLFYYEVTWEEQDSPGSASKCVKIFIHLIRLTSTGEVQQVTIYITVYLTTGGIQVQEKHREN